MIKCLLTELGRAGRENIWPSVMAHGPRCARSVRHDLGPNIFPSGPPTQSISTYSVLVHEKNVTVISSRLPAAVYFCRKGKKSSTDYPHWPITRTPKQKKIMLLYYRDKNSQTWRDEYSVLLFTKRKIDNIFC